MGEVVWDDVVEVMESLYAFSQSKKNIHRRFEKSTPGDQSRLCKRKIK